MLRRLAFIRAARNVGLSLDEAAAALATLPGGRTPTKADWTRLSQSWRHRLDEQIEALSRLRDGLDSCIGCGCLSLRRCAFSNPSDVAAGEGPGAAFLPRRLTRPGTACPVTNRSFVTQCHLVSVGIRRSTAHDYAARPHTT